MQNKKEFRVSSSLEAPAIHSGEISKLNVIVSYFAEEEKNV